MLLSLIVLFSTDNIGNQLVQKADIETLQVKYAAMLWQYLKSKTKNANREYHKGIMVSSAAEEAYEISLKRLTI